MGPEYKKNPDIAALEEAIASLAHYYKIVCAYLFGSRVTEQEKPDSDFDVAIFLEKEKCDSSTLTQTEMKLCEQLEQETGLSNIDVRIMNHAPLTVCGKVLTLGKLLFSGNEEERVRIERQTRMQYFDYQDVANRLDREILATMADEEC